MRTHTVFTTSRLDSLNVYTFFSNLFRTSDPLHIIPSTTTNSLSKVSNNMTLPWQRYILVLPLKYLIHIAIIITFSINIILGLLPSKVLFPPVLALYFKFDFASQSHIHITII